MVIKAFFKKEQQNIVNKYNTLLISTLFLKYAYILKFKMAIVFFYKLFE